MKNSDIAIALAEVIDPELGIDVVSLGLLYGIDVHDSAVNIKVTLTSPDCPMGEVLLTMLASKARSAAGHRAIRIDVVDDPQWNVRMLSDVARKRLGMEA